MAYNPYGGPGYGPPPSFNSFPGSSSAPGMAPPPGLGPPPGMSSAPGMAHPGVHQPPGTIQANRPSGLPASFQPPPNLPNINFNAPVIRLGASSLPAKPTTPGVSGRRESDAPQSASSSRPGVGLDRGLEQQRANIRESMMNTAPPTDEEKLRTIFIHKIPAGVGGEAGIERLLTSVGKLRRWDSGKSHSSDHQGELFGFAQFEDTDSLAAAVELLKEIEVPVRKQEPSEKADKAEDDDIADIDKVQLQVTVDPNSVKYIEAVQDGRGDDAEAEAKAKLDSARASLKVILRDMFFPKVQSAQDSDGDIAMGDGAANGDNVEVINIPLAQEDELADIPAEMREVVAAEIAAFRERSNRRDLERLRREEELEEMERQRNGLPRIDRLGSPSRNANSIPLGPRGGPPNAPAGPRGNQGRGVAFVNGGTTNGEQWEDVASDVDDEELYMTGQARIAAESEKQYLEAERKWVNRERQRAAALDREQERDTAEADNASRKQEEALERDRGWDDEREAGRKSHVYYRDHTAWMRKRAQDRADEEARDELDRRAEAEQRRRHEAEQETARGMADSFLERQAEEMRRMQPAAIEAAAPQRFTISFGAAAQKAQASRGPARRTVAEVEGLLDDEEADAGVKRQLIPIKFEPTTAVTSMSEEDIAKAVRALAQEIPTEKEGLWGWEVKWEFLDESVVADKLRPFVEKKVVEYLGVQDQFLVEVVEGHLRKHGKPGELVDELEVALDEAAEDMVKKLWRMVIFFTESEKRGLPA